MPQAVRRESLGDACEPGGTGERLQVAAVLHEWDTRAGKQVSFARAMLAYVPVHRFQQVGGSGHLPALAGPAVLERHSAPSIGLHLLEDPESPFPEAVRPYGQGFRDAQPTAAHEPDCELEIGPEPGGKRFDLRAGREDEIAPVRRSAIPSQPDSVQAMTREPGGSDGLVQRPGDDQPRYLPPLTGQFRQGLVEQLRGAFPVLCNLPKCAIPRMSEARG